jgi:hypothetical protein
VRAVADLLPQMEVVEGDPFNSSPTEPKLMGPDALQRLRRGEKLPTALAKTPLVRAARACPRCRVCVGGGGGCARVLCSDKQHSFTPHMRSSAVCAGA